METKVTQRKTWDQADKISPAPWHQPSTMTHISAKKQMQRYKTLLYFLPAASVANFALFSPEENKKDETQSL